MPQGFRPYRKTIGFGAAVDRASLSAKIFSIEARRAVGVGNRVTNCGSSSFEIKDCALVFSRAEAGESFDSVEHTVADGAKKTRDAIETWHPSMSFEKFGSPAREVSHEQTQTLAKAQAQHQGVDR